MSSLTYSTVSRSRMVRFSLFFSLLILVSPSFNLPAQRPPASTGKSAFTARLINIEAAVHETFQYTTTLRNNSAQTHVYALQAQLPEGWLIGYRTQGTSITAINIDGNKEQEISIDVHPARNAPPNKYTIPVFAIAGNDTLRLDLEAVVKGAYGIELITSVGLLSDQVTEGTQKEIHLVVKNTGSLPLKSISLNAQTPPKWNASFNPSSIAELEPGQTMVVVATVSVPDKTLAGDYVTTFRAQEPHVNGEAVFRITVRTSLLSGWIGLLFLLLAIGLVFFLIRKYGRR